MAATLRIARASELNQVTSFIKQNWRRDHVFVRRPELLMWQHLNKKEETLNFIVAAESAEIVGLLGFIPFRRFDESLKENTIALAVWKVIKEAGGGTGVMLLNQLVADFKPTTTIGIGLSDMVVPIYRALRFSTGVMEHFAIFHPDLEVSQITGQNVKQNKTAATPMKVIGRSLDLEESLLIKLEAMLRANTPEKSVAYYRERFERHPSFLYLMIVLGRGKDPELLLVLREVQVKGSFLVRVVDVGGDVSLLPQCASVLSELIKDRGAEYLDLVMTGVDSNEMLRNGFTCTRTDTDLVLPNYFDPFEKRTVNVAYALKSSLRESQKLHLHPSDTDQDRPNS